MTALVYVTVSSHGDHAHACQASHHIARRRFAGRLRQSKAYTDAYVVTVPGMVMLPDLVDAFYTTGLFKLERFVLTVLVAKPSTDEDAKGLAQGVLNRFAAWTVEARTEDQILMCDYLCKTRSWLMCAPGPAGFTHLYFGSAIVPDRILSNGEDYLGIGFHALLGFHKAYSVALLNAAAQNVSKSLSSAHPRRIDSSMSSANGTDI